eukprot:UN05086
MWAKKQDDKEYNEQLKEAQNIFNSDLFLDQRTRDLRRRDMGYDSDGMEEDNNEDFFDKEFCQQKMVRQIHCRRRALSRDCANHILQRREGRYNLQTRKVNEADYLKRVNAFNENLKAWEKKEANKAVSSRKSHVAVRRRPFLSR